MRQECDTDLLVIGGGINGCGIARDAAGRGLRVMLCEKDDIASHTSSWSTKLIHGGLRYLENYEFSMVRESLSEREILIKIAPHIIWPLRFVLPHARHLRPAWMIRMGLFLYDHLGRRETLPGSTKLDLREHVTGVALKGAGRVAFSYSDCATMDSRLTLLNALDAHERGATVLTRTRCARARRQEGVWHAELSTEDGATQTVTARALVNAAGPWVRSFMEDALEEPGQYRVRLVQGSHIIIPRHFDHDYAYLFQHSDNRVVFAIPYEEAFTLIGTTDVDFEGDPQSPHITEAEVDYLCEVCSTYFRQPVTPSDVVASFSGVRPLFDDASSNAAKVSREYVLDVQRGPSGDGAPVLNVFGGKLTAYRQLAEKSLDRLLPLLGESKPAWTASACLPGGDLPNADWEAFFETIVAQWPDLPQPLLQRYARQYGTRIQTLLADVTTLADLGEDFGGDMYAREVTYLIQHEWARTAEDILCRRTRQGLHAPETTTAAIEQFLRNTSD